DIRPIDLIESTGIERVAQGNVQYLCFEGGGGKGIIFLGAVKELERRGVLTYDRYRLAPNGQIRGIAGSSAGALTAVLLSCGYNARYLQRLVLGTSGNSYTPAFNFNRFFDLPTSSMPDPTPAGCRNSSRAWAWRGVGAALSSALPSAWILASRVNAASDAKMKIGAYPTQYMLNLIRQWGTFSGCASHNLFNELIARQAARRAGRSNKHAEYRNLTFAQHYRLFGCRLVLTGSNFSTGKTGFFSAETTPNFPVAAAARISMGLPLIFKPMVISSAKASQYAARSNNPRNMDARSMRGVWVDGGYFNNLPQRAFSHYRNGFDRTLGFSLQGYGSERRRIGNLAEFLLAYVNHGLFGGGESQVARSTGVAENVVPLVAGDRSFQIGTTDFSFSTASDKAAVRRLIANAQRDTARYFSTSG
ncbi:MAG: patatin-like phospholipase family protein, partial [Pseudomonadota bacterium]